MSNPFVTVVTPSYNQGQFIRATIESVLSQDYPNLEYIIMDGNSTDETASVVKDYASRLRFISENDRGQSHAINKGFRMAHGAVLAWLNSDDLFLPGAITAAVDGLARNPTAGAVYGEGYQIDHEGYYSSRFSSTEPFNLWKLVCLSDYILQPTVFFRKDVLDDVGYLDEDLHYTMDWDILIRIGMKYPLEYIPAYLGCLREYPEAKSFAGGRRRIREIYRMLRRHTGMRVPPGIIMYGLDTYYKIWCAHIRRILTPKLPSVSKRLQFLVRTCAGLIIGHTVRNAQGLYSDGWAGRVLHWMLPPGNGRIVVEGNFPDWSQSMRSRGQKLRIDANGKFLGKFPVPIGTFHLRLDLPPEFQGRLVHLKITASRWKVRGRFTLHRRRLAFRFNGIRWDAPEHQNSSVEEHTTDNSVSC